MPQLSPMKWFFFYFMFWLFFFIFCLIIWWSCIKNYIFY